MLYILFYKWIQENGTMDVRGTTGDWNIRILVSLWVTIEHRLMFLFDLMLLLWWILSAFGRKKINLIIIFLIWFVFDGKMHTTHTWQLLNVMIELRIYRFLTVLTTECFKNNEFLVYSRLGITMGRLCQNLLNFKNGFFSPTF
jgi:hypothetical protein